MLTDEHLCNRGGAIFNRSFSFQFQAYALTFNADVLPPSNEKPEKIMKHGKKYFPLCYNDVMYRSVLEIAQMRSLGRRRTKLYQ